MTDQEKKYLTYGIIAAAVVGGYFLFFNKTEAGTGGLDPTGNGTVNPGNGGVVPASFDAQHVADTLLDAMKDMGTDEETIISVLTPVNQTQFGLVFSAFGSPPYNSLYGNQVNWAPWTDLPAKNLKIWLKSEMSTEQYDVLRRKYPNYL